MSSVNRCLEITTTSTIISSITTIVSSVPTVIVCKHGKSSSHCKDDNSPAISTISTIHCLTEQRTAKQSSSKTKAGSAQCSHTVLSGRLLLYILLLRRIVALRRILLIALRWIALWRVVLLWIATVLVRRRLAVALWWTTL